MAFDPRPEEIADRYAEARARVIGIARPLTGDQLVVTVPGTPDWTVLELLSHLVGCGLELAAGNVEGAGGDEWTQAQVEARRGRSVSELLSEWDNGFATIDQQIRNGNIPSPIAFDAITHEQDLRGAVRAEPLDDPAAVGFVADGFGSRAVAVAAKAGLPDLELRDDQCGWSIGTPGGTCLSAPKFEIFRTIAGRRSSGQVAAMAWTGDPAPYLAKLSPFGPLRDTDVLD
jgi:uncharacterized protein (TIGR03083 family)